MKTFRIVAQIGDVKAKWDIIAINIHQAMNKIEQSGPFQNTEGSRIVEARELVFKSRLGHYKG